MEQTPIEELQKELREIIAFHCGGTYEAKQKAVEEILAKDKAHREKYKHTKEDVVNAYVEGHKDMVMIHYGRGLSESETERVKIEAEQYYKQQHENE